jgi:hypothetical protein
MQMAGDTESENTVFEIAKTGSGYASTPSTLFSFDGTNGEFPNGSLIADAAGDLFGTTPRGGANSGGTRIGRASGKTTRNGSAVQVGFSGVRYCSDGQGIDGRLRHLVRVRRDTRAALSGRLDLGLHLGLDLGLRFGPSSATTSDFGWAVNSGVQCCPNGSRLLARNSTTARSSTENGLTI